MSAKPQEQAASRLSIPQVQCPRCGSIMRLCHVLPEPDQSSKETIVFDCECGFEYQQSSRVRDLAS